MKFIPKDYCLKLQHLGCRSDTNFYYLKNNDVIYKPELPNADIECLAFHPLLDFCDETIQSIENITNITRWLGWARGTNLLFVIKFIVESKNYDKVICDLVDEYSGINFKIQNYKIKYEKFQT